MQKVMANLQNLSSQELQELQELLELKKQGRIKVKGEEKTRQELLAYNHYRQNRLNHYVKAMFKVITDNELENQVNMFDKSLDSYIQDVTSQLAENPNAKISKGKKATLPSFAVFETEK